MNPGKTGETLIGSRVDRPENLGLGVAGRREILRPIENRHPAETTGAHAAAGMGQGKQG